MRRRLWPSVSDEGSAKKRTAQDSPASTTPDESIQQLPKKILTRFAVLVKRLSKQNLNSYRQSRQTFSSTIKKSNFPLYDGLPSIKKNVLADNH